MIATPAISPASNVLFPCFRRRTIVTFVRCSPNSEKKKRKAKPKNIQTTNHQVRRRWTKVREEEERGKGKQDIQ